MVTRYEKPPIHEVVIGIYFSHPIIALRSEHIGLFWSSIEDDFPTVRQSDVLGPEVFVDPEASPMPRYWFTSKDETHLIQVQKTAFLFNWRRRGGDYPHFESVKAEFDKLYGKFVEFLKLRLKIEEPQIHTCELSYFNVIEKSEYWSTVDDTTKIIPSFSILKPCLPNVTPYEFDYTSVVNVESDLHLKINLKKRVTSDENEDPVLILELRTTGILGEKSSKVTADLWFSRAHDTIIDSFNGITDTKVQKELWKREDEQ